MLVEGADTMNSDNEFHKLMLYTVAWERKIVTSIPIVYHSGGLLSGAGLNDGLFQKRWTFVTLPSVLSTVCIAQN